MESRTKKSLRALLACLLTLVMLFGVVPMNAIVKAVSNFSDGEPSADVRDYNLEGSGAVDSSNPNDPKDVDKPGASDPEDPDNPGASDPEDPDKPGASDPKDPDKSGASDPKDPDKPDQSNPEDPDLDPGLDLNLNPDLASNNPGLDLEQIDSTHSQMSLFANIDANITQDITPGERSLRFHLVTFMTQGSHVEPAIVRDGDLLMQPENPTRMGFEFLHWTIDGEKFDFARSPITKNTTLVAAWKAKMVSYKVVRWVEVPDPVENPANPMANYRYHDRSTHYAPAGSMVDFSNKNRLRERGILLDDIKVIGENEGKVINVQYAEFVRGDSDVKVLGNGNTVVNVFFDRIQFKYEFDLRPLVGPPYSLTSDRTFTQVQLTTPEGKVFKQGYDIENITEHTEEPARIDERYSFYAAYGQDITGLWPAIGDGFTVEVFARTISGYDFTWGEITETTVSTATGWLANYIKNDDTRHFGDKGSDMALVDNSWHMWSIPRITHYLVPLDGPGKPAVFAANWSTRTIPRTVQFFFEALPHEVNTSEAIEFPENGTLHTEDFVIPGIKFVRNHSWQTTFVGGIGGAAQKGTEVYGRSHLLNGAQTNNDPNSGADTFRFFHTRNRHDIKFNTQGGEPIEPVKDVMYGDRVGNYLPPDPGDRTHKGRKLCFGGWFMDADFVEPFDPDMTMPDGNVLLFARWVSAEYKVKLLYNINGPEIESSPVHPCENGFLDDMHMPIRLNKSVDGWGVLEGWYRLQGGRLFPFSFESPIKSDMTLVARWQNDNFTVTVDITAPPLPGSGDSGNTEKPITTPPVAVPPTVTPPSTVPPTVTSPSTVPPTVTSPAAAQAASAVKVPAVAAPAVVPGDSDNPAETAGTLTPLGQVIAEIAQTIPETEPEPEADDEEESLIAIDNPEVPSTPMGDGKSWSLLNLILSIASVVLALLLGIRVMMKKRRENEGEEQFETEHAAHDDEKDKRDRLLLMLAVPLFANIEIVLFLLTQDMRHPMILIDWWTPVHAILTAGGLFSYIFAYKRNKDSDSVNPHQASKQA